MTSSAGASGLILVGVAAELGDGLAHRGEVDDAGHAGEVLHDHARRGELDLGVGLGVLVPRRRRARMWSAVMLAPSSVRSRFSSSTLRLYGQRLAALDRGEPVDLVGLLTHLERAVGVEAVRAGHRGSLQVVRRRAIPVIYLDVKISNHTGSVTSSLCRGVPTRETGVRPGCSGPDEARDALDVVRHREGVEGPQAVAAGSRGRPGRRCRGPGRPGRRRRRRPRADAAPRSRRTRHGRRRCAAGRARRRPPPSA